jgi:hypothetical protein
VFGTVGSTKICKSAQFGKVETSVQLTPASTLFSSIPGRSGSGRQQDVLVKTVEEEPAATAGK